MKDLKCLPCQLKYTHEDIARCIELFVSGLTLLQIQIITGINETLISRWISKHYFGYRGDKKIIITLNSKV